MLFTDIVGRGKMCYVLHSFILLLPLYYPLCPVCLPVPSLALPYITCLWHRTILRRLCVVMTWDLVERIFRITSLVYMLKSWIKSYFCSSMVCRCLSLRILHWRRGLLDPRIGPAYRIQDSRQGRWTTWFYLTTVDADSTTTSTLIRSSLRIPTCCGKYRLIFQALVCAHVLPLKLLCDAIHETLSATPLLCVRSSSRTVILWVIT